MKFDRRSLVVASPLLLLPRRVLAASTRRLTILHTNDTHSRIEPFDSGKFAGLAGIAKRAALIKRVRRENAATIVVDAGDTFQGTVWFNTFKGDFDCRALHALQYDATALGNHDFDAGVDQLAKNLKRAPNLATLSANFAVSKDCPLKGRVRPNRIIERGGIKVGLFGLGIAFHGLVSPRLHKGFAYVDPVAAAKDQVQYLRDAGCDVVIALSHLGYQSRGSEPSDLDWPTMVAGVDYVVGGHTHTFLKEPTMVAHSSGWRTAVMQVGHSGLNLGRADILVDGRGKVALSRSRPIGVGGRAIA